MKVRRELLGLHCYDRVSGIHLLLDECPQASALCDIGPRVVSIALTNVCDARCQFCYAPKTNDSLPASAVLSWCRELDELGSLEVAFGGGEPALYPELTELCNQIWSSTQLGISITSNGHHINSALVSALAGSVSIVRFSVDALEPLYSAIRGRSMSAVICALDMAQDVMPVGINTVINRATLPGLDQILAFLVHRGISDWLLLPEVARGGFVLSPDEWDALSEFVARCPRHVRLSTTSAARRFLKGSFLFPPDDEGSYAHISATGQLSESSYGGRGVPLWDSTVHEALVHLAAP